jgi:hypothetical protein
MAAGKHKRALMLNSQLGKGTQFSTAGDAD